MDSKYIDKSIQNYPTLKKVDSGTEQRLLESFHEVSKSKDFLLASLVSMAWQKHQMSKNLPASLHDLQQYFESNKINICIEPSLDVQGKDLKALSVDQKKCVKYGSIFHVGIKSYVDQSMNNIFSKMTQDEYYQRLYETGYWITSDSLNDSTDICSSPAIKKLLLDHKIVLKNIPKLSEYLTNKLSELKKQGIEYEQSLYGMNSEGGPIMVFINSKTREIVCPVITSGYYNKNAELIINFEILSNSNLYHVL